MLPLTNLFEARVFQLNAEVTYFDLSFLTEIWKSVLLLTHLA